MTITHLSVHMTLLQNTVHCLRKKVLMYRFFPRCRSQIFMRLLKVGALLLQIEFTNKFSKVRYFKVSFADRHSIYMITYWCVVEQLSFNKSDGEETKAETQSWSVLVMRTTSSSIPQGRKLCFWTMVPNVVFTKFYKTFVACI